MLNQSLENILNTLDTSKNIWRWIASNQEISNPSVDEKRRTKSSFVSLPQGPNVENRKIQNINPYGIPHFSCEF